MSVEDVNNVEEQGPEELEVPNLIEVVFPPVGKREPSYPKAAVDSVLQSAQEYIDRTAQYVTAYRDLDEQYATLVNNYNELSAQFGEAEVESQKVIAELTEQVGQLEHANAALRHRAQEIAEAQASQPEEPEVPSDVAQSSALLQRAAELAEQHVNDARRQAAQIVSEAEESLTSLKAETAALREEKVAVIDSVVSFLSAKTEEFQARR